jgi:phenylacetate-coenzyme A ligase PaaK-like adenylate-forming protein/acyl-CoA reductase-like NAD-dependent aldehyde dehydrogenase
MTTQHLWGGAWIGDRELDARLGRLDAFAAAGAARPLDTGVLLAAADSYARLLKAKKGNYAALASALRAGRTPAADIEPTILEAASFLERPHLEAKLRRELGSTRPFLPTRIRFDDSLFESWAPLGLLVHVAPSNSTAVAPLSVVEGLLAGNVNVLKTGRGDSSFSQAFLKGLLDQDPSGELARFVACLSISSREAVRLGKLFAAADGIAAWGGEEAMASIRRSAPSSARVVEWGHKISFVYLAADRLHDSEILKAAAREVCQFEQQACSSPQVIYVETSDRKKLRAFASRFAEVLAGVSKTVRATAPEAPERAEITLAVELAREEAALGLTDVIEDPSGKWRVLVDDRPALAASPLFRTIRVKPLPRAGIVKTLRPMRRYLQTAGLSCGLGDLAELSEALIAAGAVRVRRVGEMAGSYDGEAHDGVYALQRYARRVGVQAGPDAAGVSNFADLRAPAAPAAFKKTPLMGKAEFQSMTVDAGDAHLFFKSGGSSGAPKLSVFTYDDYAAQMSAGAEGLYAAGLDPLADRSMNLFFSGGLYGGFLSIFSVLEALRAPQFPMAAVMDFPAVAEAIVENKITVLLGMPSYVIQLFAEGEKSLGLYRGVKKVFYGGEHFNDAQRRHLRERFGVETIKSVGYGSVDTGPLGYQCAACEGSVHHLHSRLQFLEIVDLAKDRPAAPGEAGRLVFTSLARRGQALNRYDLGDVGRWESGPCPCGRASPRFRLLGRSGDVMRVGSMFLNYGKFVAVLAEKLDYSGSVQIRLTHEGLREKLSLQIASEAGRRPEDARRVLLSDYHDLNEVVEVEKMLLLEVTAAPSRAFERLKGSGKLARIVDERKR